MIHPCPAHSGHVISLTSSSDECSTGIVISYGSDNVIHIWQLGVNKEREIVLKNTGSIVPSSPPVCMVLMGTRLCVAVAVNHQILVYDLVNQEKASWQQFPTGSWSGLTPLLHQPEDDHADQVLAVAASPHLLLFASSGKDGKVKVWSQDNQLVADIHLGSDHELSVVCFANSCGDLLVGFQQQICLVKAELFLCSQNKQGTAAGGEETSMDAAIPFDPDLEFWSVSFGALHVFYTWVSELILIWPVSLHSSCSVPLLC